MLVTPGPCTRWSTPLFSHDSEQPTTPVPRKLKAKNGLVRLPGGCPDTRRELATNTRAVVKNLRMEPRTSGRRARQRHTSTSRFHETSRKRWRRHPTLRPRGTSFRRLRDDASTNSLPSFSTFSSTPLVSFATPCKIRHPSLDLASSGGTVAS